MSLVIDLFDPDSGPYSYLNAIEYDAAGFERYRKELWGSQSLIDHGAEFFPKLDGGDLFVYPSELDAFESECRMVDDAARIIANELWGEPERAAHIREYISTFLNAIELARSRNVGVCIS